MPVKWLQSFPGKTRIAKMAFLKRFPEIHIFPFRRKYSQLASHEK